MSEEADPECRGKVRCRRGPVPHGQPGSESLPQQLSHRVCTHVPRMWLGEASEGKGQILSQVLCLTLGPSTPPPHVPSGIIQEKLKKISLRCV